jgi:hypothetical protein
VSPAGNYTAQLHPRMGSATSLNTRFLGKSPPPFGRRAFPEPRRSARKKVMIRCDPIGICSWAFRLTGPTSDEAATIRFRWVSEEGTIDTPKACYHVAKLGMFSGTWQLERDGAVAAVARKRNPLLRRFEIEYDGRRAVLEAQTALSRVMILNTPNAGGGTIAPAHPFTRRGTIEVVGIPFEIQCFAFWLTALIWKRDSSSDAGASAS